MIRRPRSASEHAVKGRALRVSGRFFCGLLNGFWEKQGKGRRGQTNAPNDMERQMEVKGPAPEALHAPAVQYPRGYGGHNADGGDGRLGNPIDAAAEVMWGGEGDHNGDAAEAGGHADPDDDGKGQEDGPLKGPVHARHNGAACG